MRMVRPEDVVEAVVWYTGVDPRHEKLTRRVAFSRRLAYAAMMQLDLSLGDISDYFGRDHTSIMRTCKRPIEVRGAMGEVMARITYQLATESANDAEHLARMEEARLVVQLESEMHR